MSNFKLRNTYIGGFILFLFSLWCFVSSLIETDVVYLLLGVVFLLCTVVLVVFRRAIQEDVFSPIFVAVGAIILTYGIGGIYLYTNLEGFYRSFITRQDPSIICALLLVILFIVCFLFGLVFIHPIKFRKMSVFAGDINLGKAKVITVLFIFLGIMTYYGMVRSLGYGGIGEIGRNVMAFRTSASTQGRYYFKFLYEILIQSPFFLWLVLYYKYRGSMKRNFTLKAFLLSYLFVILLMGLISGSRSQVIHPLLGCVFIYNCLRKKVSVSLIVLFIVIMMPFILSYAIYRNLPSRDMGDIALEKKIEICVNALSFDSVTRAFVTRFNAAFENLIHLLNLSEREFLWGKSFVDFLYQPIPRAIFPDKPYLFGMAMTKKIYPEFFARGGGTSFGLIPEAFMNFHIGGVILFGMVFGFLIGFLQKLYFYNRENPFFVFFYINLFTVPWGWLAGGLVNSGMNEIIILNLVFYAGLYFLVVKRNKMRLCYATAAPTGR